MKKLIFLLCPICLMWLTSCLTVDRIERNCDKFARICVTPVSTVTVYRDTTIYEVDTVFYKLPADTITITDTVKIVGNYCYLPPVTRSFGLIGVTAGVSSSILRVTAWLKDSTILIARPDTVFISNAISSTTTQQTLTVEKKEIPGIAILIFWSFIIALVIVSLYITWSAFFRK